MFTFFIVLSLFAAHPARAQDSSAQNPAIVSIETPYALVSMHSGIFLLAFLFWSNLLISFWNPKYKLIAFGSPIVDTLLKLLNPAEKAQNIAIKDNSLTVSTAESTGDESLESDAKQTVSGWTKFYIFFTSFALVCNTLALIFVPLPRGDGEDPYAFDESANEDKIRVFSYHILRFIGGIIIAFMALVVDPVEKAWQFSFGVTLRSSFFGAFMLPTFHDPTPKDKDILTVIHSVGTLFLMYIGAGVIAGGVDANGNPTPAAFDAFPNAWLFKFFGVCCVTFNMLNMYVRAWDLAKTSFGQWVGYFNKVATGYMMSMKCFLVIKNALQKEVTNGSDLGGLERLFVQDKGDGKVAVRSATARIWLAIFLLIVICVPCYHYSLGELKKSE